MSATSVLHLSRQLLRPPKLENVPGVVVRTFTGENDIDTWLELRERAFIGEKPAVRSWTRADFAAEFLNKPWWLPERLWFAETDGAIGSITLAYRGRESTAVPVIHWLMVMPESRRKGIGRVLLSRVEVAAWQAGHRRICLETHGAWSAAVLFYQALGYV